MKKLLVLLAVLAMTGVANAAIVDMLTNGSFETHADDGYGREMPADFGLWTDGGNWDNIPDTQISTADALTGAASFQIAMGTGYSDIALTYAVGQLATGWYHAGGQVKGAGAAGLIGVDMFSTDWSAYYWGGGVDISGSVAGEWTYFGFDFEVTDPTVQFNFVIKGFNSSADFLIDDVQLVTDIVPEPATMAILGLGGLLIRRKK